jgi:DNA adenine methylase
MGFLKSVLGYYGGKFNMRERIVDLFPAHETYNEVFVGGGAVFWFKRPSQLERINDLDRRVITFYEVCKDSKMFAELQGLIRKTLHSRALYSDCKLIMKAVGTDCEPSKAEQAWAFWYLCNGSFMNQYGAQWAYQTKAQDNRLGAPGSLNEKRILFETDAICERLRTTAIECQPANQVIKRYDYDGALFYCDPPYFGTTMSYKAQAHGKSYSEQDFNGLLAILSGIKGKFILSCYPSALVSQYAEDFGWDCDSYSMSLSASKVSGEGSREGRKTECLFYNFETTQLLKPTLFPT